MNMNFKTSYQPQKLLNIDDDIQFDIVKKALEDCESPYLFTIRADKIYYSSSIDLDNIAIIIADYIDTVFVSKLEEIYVSVFDFLLDNQVIIVDNDCYNDFKASLDVYVTDFVNSYDISDFKFPIESFCHNAKDKAFMDILDLMYYLSEYGVEFCYSDLSDFILDFNDVYEQMCKLQESFLCCDEVDE